MTLTFRRGGSPPPLFAKPWATGRRASRFQALLCPPAPGPTSLCPPDGTGWPPGSAKSSNSGQGSERSRRGKALGPHWLETAWPARATSSEFYRPQPSQPCLPAQPHSLLTEPRLPPPQGKVLLPGHTRVPGRDTISRNCCSGAAQPRGSGQERRRSFQPPATSTDEEAEAGSWPSSRGRLREQLWVLPSVLSWPCPLHVT